MKKYIKLVVIVLFAITTTLSAQQTTSFNSELPETWKPNLSNTNVGKSMNPRQTQQQYTPAEFSKGRSYNVVNTESRTNLPTSATLSNSNNDSYYRSYGMNQTATPNVTYNAPAQIEQATINAVETTPFNDVVTIDNRMNALDRNDKPNDPAVPLGDVAIPMLIFALAWIKVRSKE